MQLHLPGFAEKLWTGSSRQRQMENSKPVRLSEETEAGMSANYVTLDGGYIYVAYGKNRLRVMKLIDGTASGNGTNWHKVSDLSNINTR